MSLSNSPILPFKKKKKKKEGRRKEKTEFYV